ncbi:hypothetical protein D8I24_0841 [Cupriavidus necator H850]|nr:hypothetical protein D8I24_0841 [Cupriavidus necator H850]
MDRARRPAALAAAGCVTTLSRLYRLGPLAGRAGPKLAGKADQPCRPERRLPGRISA